MNPVTITFTEDELNAFVQMLDVAVKASGLQGARPAIAMLMKIEDAIRSANPQAAAPVAEEE